MKTPAIQKDKRLLIYTCIYLFIYAYTIKIHTMSVVKTQEKQYIIGSLLFK